MSLSSKQKRILLLLSGLGLFFVGSTLVMAATGNAPSNSIGSVADTVQESFGSLSKLLTSASYIMGTGFVIASLFKFKSHKDNPTQEQIGKPIALLFIGAAMIFLPSVMKTGGATIFGSNASSAGISGISSIS